MIVSVDAAISYGIAQILSHAVVVAMLPTLSVRNSYGTPNLRTTTMLNTLNMRRNMRIDPKRAAKHWKTRTCYTHWKTPQTQLKKRKCGTCRQSPREEHMKKTDAIRDENITSLIRKHFRSGKFCLATQYEFP